MSIEHNDATELSDSTGEVDRFDADLDGSPDAEDLQSMAVQEGTDPGSAASESVQDLVDDGGDLALSLDDDARQENRLDGVVPLDDEIVVDDPNQDETIEDRIQQEEYDPTSAIVPPDAGRRH